MTASYNLPKNTAPQSVELTVMVIMPFHHTPTRGEVELTAFFRDQIKRPIEQARLQYRYKVVRSDETFNITSDIIQTLHSADIVVCDLSGTVPNPNVMYELGVRLALSDKPVILIREQHESNRGIFDIAGFFTFSYSATDSELLADHLIHKLARFESGEEVFRSPVLDLVGGEADVPATRNRKAGHTITMLSLGIEMAAKQYHAAILDLILVQSPDQCPPGRDWHGNLEWFVNNAKVLEGLGWPEFDQWPRSNPLIDGFWTCSELRDALPEAVFANISGLLYNYFAHYFSGELLWRLGPVAQTVAFFVDTACVINIKEPTLALLDAKNRDLFDRIVKIIIKHAQRSFCWGHSSEHGDNESWIAMRKTT